MTDSRIIRVSAREILDSRGNPTVEVEVRTKSGAARAAAPSGASTGTHEAVELRDGGHRYGGKGVLKAVESVNKIIAPRLEGMDVTCQRDIDRLLIDLDGTPNKSRLGGNAITAVSLACAKTGAVVTGVEFHEYLEKGSNILPVPLMNIINGGKHAGGNLRIQEFMIVPAGMKSFSEALRAGAEVYSSLRSLLRKKYGSGAINVGDEGGFAPPLNATDEALDVLINAIESAGYLPGKDVFLAVDSAASEFFSDGFYEFDGRRFNEDEIIEFYKDLVSHYPIISLEDPVEENSFGTMARLTREIGESIQVVGDDIFVTNVERLKRGIAEGAGNALLLKVNQIGTITESFEAANLAFRSGYNVVVSHRSGETEDTSIADIAVALGCGQIKTGAPARGERTAKYNRLLLIEELLGSRSRFLGIDAIKRLRGA
ncbi:MAG: phosphopyruvate hydratase [Methanomassiliicoccales archaeon]|jgi:enolase|nr:phosphopyruvate hydratase [Methanomassiliicoccales archaeon]